MTDSGIRQGRNKCAAPAYEYNTTSTPHTNLFTNYNVRIPTADLLSGDWTFMLDQRFKGTSSQSQRYPSTAHFLTMIHYFSLIFFSEGRTEQILSRAFSSTKKSVWSMSWQQKNKCTCFPDRKDEYTIEWVHIQSDADT